MLIARPSVPEDCDYLAKALRKEDVDEITAASNLSPKWALSVGMEVGRCWTCDDGNPVAMFGVSPWPEQLSTGYPWMLASDRLVLHQKRFLRECRTWVSTLSEGFDRLVTFSDARNTLHHKWLTWCGFQRGRTVPYGVSQLPFIEFRKYP